jgi:hypothetical protein
LKKYFYILVFIIICNKNSIVFADTHTSMTAGNWSAITWSPAGLPASSDYVIINTNVTVNAPASCGNITVNSSKALTVTSTLTIGGIFNNSNIVNNGTITINTGGSIVCSSDPGSSYYGLNNNSGTFNLNAGSMTIKGKISSTGSGKIITINSGATLNLSTSANIATGSNIVCSGTMIVLGSGLNLYFNGTSTDTKQGTLQLNNGTSAYMKSTFIFYAINFNTSGSSTPLYIEQDGTIYNTNGASGTGYFSITSGKTLYIEGTALAGNSSAGYFRGNATVSFCSGKDSYTNWSQIAQTIPTSGTVADYGYYNLEINNSMGATTNTSLDITIKNSLILTNGVLTLGANKWLWFNTGDNPIVKGTPGGTITTASTNTIAFGCNTPSYPAGATYTLPDNIFTSNPTNLSSIVFARTNPLTLNNQDIVLTNGISMWTGLLVIGSGNVTLLPTATVGGNPCSSSNMIVPTNSGQLRKRFDITHTSFTYPVGDNTGTAEYSPAFLQFTSASYAVGAYMGINLKNLVHPQVSSSGYSNYITRYWTATNSGITSFSCNVQYTYVDADMFPDASIESTLKSDKYDGSSVPYTETVMGDVNTTNNYVYGTVTGFSDFTASNNNSCTYAPDVTPNEYDYVWAGISTTTWETASNWRKYSGGNYVTVSAAPTSTDNVLVTGGTCISGQPTATTAGAVCNNLTVTSTGILTIADAQLLTVNGSVTNNGTITSTTGTGSIKVKGDWINNLTFTAGTGTVTFNGTAAQSIGGTSGTTFYNLYIDKTNTATANINLPVTNDFIIKKGTFDVNGKTIDMTGASGIDIGDASGSDDAFLQMSGGTINVSSATADVKRIDIKSDGQFDMDGGTCNLIATVSDDYDYTMHIEAGGVFDITAGTLNITNNSNNWWLKLYNSGTIVMSGGTINIDDDYNNYGTLTMSGGTMNTEYDDAGNLSVGSIYIRSGSIITLSGSSVIHCGGNINFYTATMTATGGTVYMDAGANAGTTFIGTYGTDVSPQFYHLVINNDVVLDEGSPTGDEYLDVNGNLTINTGKSLNTVNSTNAAVNIFAARNWTNDGTFTPNTNTVTFDGTSGVTQEVRNGSSAFYNVIINHAGVSPSDDLVQFRSDVSINNDLTITDGTLEGDGGENGYILTVGANWINNSPDDGFHRGEGSVVLAGSSMNISGSNPTIFRNLTINGSYTLNQNIYIAGSITSGNLINNGTFDATTNLTTVFLGRETHSYNQSIGAGAQSISFYNLTVLGNSISGTSTLNQDVTVTKDLLISSGTFDANGKNIKIYGDWTNNSAFTHNSTAFDGSGYVEFNGSAAQSINGSLITTFYNLVMNNSSTGVTLNIASNVDRKIEFTSGILHTAAGLITLNDTAFVTSGGSFGDGYAGKSTSFVDGPIKKIGRNRVQGGGGGSGSWHGVYGNEWTMTFPTGKASKWAPVSLAHFSGTTATTDEFTAEYYNSGYGSYTVLSPLDHVSNIEWWSLAKGSGNVNLTKRIFLYSKDLAFSNIQNINDPDLVVAHYNGSDWEDCSRLSNGTDYVKSDNWGTFSPFTFASKSKSNPLPVELLSFNAKPRDIVVDVFWSTASELNNDYFIIERSIDGIEFFPIAIVNGAGTSNATLEYSCTDNDPFTGKSYYRLKQTDFDGQFEIFDPVAVTINEQQTFSYTVYPNPATKILNIVYENADENAFIEINNLLGKIIFSQSLEKSDQLNKITLDISGFEKGIYFVKIMSAGTITVKKIVIQ